MKSNFRKILILWIVCLPYLLYCENKISLENYLFETEPNPGCLKVSQQGNIFIADKKNYVIHKFSPQGQHILAIGGKGQGPGFFQRWMGMYDIGVDGEICQSDFFNGNRRITLFTEKGKLIDSFIIKDVTNFGSTDIIALKNGKFIVGVIQNIITETKGHFHLMGMLINYSIVNKKGILEKSLFKEKVLFSFSDESESGWPNLPYASYIVSAYSPKSNTFAYQSMSSNTLKLINLENFQTFEIKNGFTLELINDNDIKEWIENEKEENKMFQYMKPIYNKLSKFGKQIVSIKPIIQRLMFDPEGNCFIIAYKEKDKIYKVRKFSKDFKFIKAIELKSIPLFIDKNHLYYIGYMEEDDTNYLFIKDRDYFF